MSTTKVAVVQAASVAFDLERCLKKTADLAADAARKGAKIVVFPEAFLSGYPKGSSFGAVVGARTDAGREEYRLYWESAVDVPGGLLATLSGPVVMLIVTGGVVYTLGVAFYLWERLPFHYTIWHALVLAASGVFYAAVTLHLVQTA